MSDKIKPSLPGPSDEVISAEIRRHMALCGPDFPDCGMGHAMRYIFAQEDNRRTPDARLEAERAVIEAATRQHDWESGCSEHWRPIDDDWSRDYWDEFDPFTRLDDAIRASRRRAK